MTEGIIVKISSGIYTVKCEDKVFECKVRGRMRIRDAVPIVGDRCLVSEDDTVICDLFPRKNSMIRPKLANIDNLLIVFAAADPKPLPGVIDKLLVMAEKNGTSPVIVITKSDIGDETEISTYVETYEKAGYTVFVTSDKCSTVEFPKGFFSGKITAVAGCSGVGKSTLLNRIFGNTLFRTGEISEKSKRGKNTTTCIELLEKDGGYVADTPGFSSFELIDIEKEELETLFPEISKATGHCRFVGCSHINEPGCGVKTALDEGRIARSRYENYVKMYNDLKNIKKY